MAIMTVNGKIDRKTLGVSLAHEHLLIDLRGLVDRPDPKENPKFYEPLRMDNRRYIWSDPYAMLDNALIGDEKTAVSEAKIAKEDGVDTIVDVTLSDIARDPLALRRISKESGVNVVMGCGHYIDGSLGEKVRSMTETELTDEILNDLKKGAEGTDVCAGVIGEIGTSAEVTADEWKNVRAAGFAAVETGAGVHIHTALWERNGIAVAKTLIGLGVRPSKICINHIDVDIREDYLSELVDLGVIVEYDNFGKEFYIPKRERGLLLGRFAYDLERCRSIAGLVKRGYKKQIFVCNDICLKNMLCAYGGNGYAHITRNIVPMLADVGLSESEIDCILRENPADFLDREDL